MREYEYDELLYTQEDIDQRMMTCEELQGKIKDLEEEIEELQGLEERVRKETAAHILSHLREWGFRVQYGRILSTGKESVDWCIGAMSCGKELTHETDVLAQDYGLNRRQGTNKYE